MAETHPIPTTGTDNYVVVARRYRPRGFQELVGQDQVSRALTNAIETGRVGHAYLFTGARGVGKTSTARIFAKALNNPSGPSASPDNTSDTAQAIDSGEDVDVIEIDGASNRGIDEIRSLRANVGMRPSRSRYKIYIIDEVHMLTTPAFNALLKTLEEPPEHVKFIFCTTDPEKIPITVLSRCQRFDFAPVEVSQIATRLREIVAAEGAEADDAALDLIARRAAGSMRDSQSLLEQVLSFSSGRLTADQVHAMLGTADDDRLHALALAMASRNAAESLRQLDGAIDAGVDAGRLAEQLLGYFRDLMAVTVGCESTMQRHTAASMYSELNQLGEQWGLQTVLAIVGLLDHTLVRIRHSVYSRVLLEATLIQACQLPDLQRLVDLTTAANQAPVSVEKKNDPRLAGHHFDHMARSGMSPITSGSSSAIAMAVPIAAPQSHATSTIGSSLSSSGSAPTATLSLLPGRQAASRIDGAKQPAQVKDPVPTSQTFTKSEVAPVTWTTRGVTELWQNALTRMDPMTQTMARVTERVECLAPGRLRLVFPSTARLTMSRCDTPVHREELLKVLRSIAGESVQIEFGLSADAVAVPAAQKTPAKSRIQRMRELEEHELVKACIELFDAEIVKVDLPQPPKS